MRFPIIALVLLVGLVACGDEPANTGGSGQPEASNPNTEGNKPPAETGTVIKVQHVLIAFRGAPGFSGRSVPPKALKRTKDRAATIASDVLSKAKGGFDFTNLVRTYSDDQINPADKIPGVYTIVEGRDPQGTEFGRPGKSQRSLVKGFDDVSWSLKVGEVGIAQFDPANSPFGWHIIKRIE